MFRAIDFDHPPVGRHTNNSLPAYRFVPGDLDTPHPTDDPRGHSFHTDEAPVSPAPTSIDQPENWVHCSVYLYGCDLYNHAYWWEAHEAWEDIWRECRRGSAQFEFLQALIQYSAAALKIRQRKPRGLQQLLTTAGDHMRQAIQCGASPVYMGIDIQLWHNELDAYYTPMLHNPDISMHHDACAFPYIRLVMPESDP